MEESTASTNPRRKGLDTEAEVHPGRRAVLVAGAIGEALVESGTAIIGGLGSLSLDGHREGVAQEPQLALAHTVASPMRVNPTIVETVRR